MKIEEQYTNPEQSQQLKDAGLRQDTWARWIRRRGENRWEFSYGNHNAANLPSPNYESVAAYTMIELGVASSRHATMEALHEWMERTVKEVVDGATLLGPGTANNRIGPC